MILIHIQLNDQLVNPVNSKLDITKAGSPCWNCLIDKHDLSDSDINCFESRIAKEGILLLHNLHEFKLGLCNRLKEETFVKLNQASF